MCDSLFNFTKFYGKEKEGSSELMIFYEQFAIKMKTFIFMKSIITWRQRKSSF